MTTPSFVIGQWYWLRVDGPDGIQNVLAKRVSTPRFQEDGTWFLVPDFGNEVYSYNPETGWMHKWTLTGYSPVPQPSSTIYLDA